MLYLISKGFPLSLLLQLLFPVFLAFATKESRNDLNIKVKKKTVGQKETFAMWLVMMESSTKCIVRVVRFPSLREAKYFSASGPFVPQF